MSGGSAAAGLFDLRGQVVLLTGSTGGLGQSIAEVLAAQGAALVLSDRDPAALARQAEALRAGGAEVQELLADLLDPLAANELASAARDWRGRIDTLVSNAGMQGPAGPLGAAIEADWDRVMQLNLRSAAALSCTLAPFMAAQGGGAIVLMASLAALRGNKAIGLYGLSKAALAQLARNLAVEWGPANVRANAIAPGLIRTPLATQLLQDEAFMKRRLTATPLRRVGEPQEIAGVVALLASRAGAFITGQTLVVDGGTLISDGA